jgi:hypothetical protein
MKAVFRSKSFKPGAVDVVHDSPSGKVLAHIGERFETEDGVLILELVGMGYVPLSAKWDDMKDSALIAALKKLGVKLQRIEKVEEVPEEKRPKTEEPPAEAPPAAPKKPRKGKGK